MWSLLDDDRARKDATRVQLSVVVPTLNEEKHIGELLSDLAAQTRVPEEIIVVDGESSDSTVRIVERFPETQLLLSPPSVSKQRNLGGRKACGDLVVFLDADARLPRTFLEKFVEKFEERRLDLACPVFLAPDDSTPSIKCVHVFFAVVFMGLQKILPSGSGQCIAVRREVFQESAGFDTGLTFADDMELIRRLSKGRRFGVINEDIFVSDRRFRKYGLWRTVTGLLLMSAIFTLGRFEWANRIEYKFGDYGS